MIIWLRSLKNRVHIANRPTQGRTTQQIDDNQLTHTDHAVSPVSRTGLILASFPGFTHARYCARVMRWRPQGPVVLPADKCCCNLQSGHFLWSLVHVAVHFRLFRERYGPARPQRKTAHPTSLEH